MQNIFETPYTAALRNPQMGAPSGGGMVAGGRTFDPNAALAPAQPAQPMLSLEQATMLAKGLKKYGQKKGWLGSEPVGPALIRKLKNLF